MPTCATKREVTNGPDKRTVALAQNFPQFSSDETYTAYRQKTRALGTHGVASNATMEANPLCRTSIT